MITNGRKYITHIELLDPYYKSCCLYVHLLQAAYSYTRQIRDNITYEQVVDFKNKDGDLYKEQPDQTAKDFIDTFFTAEAKEELEYYLLLKQLE